jgi:hypothetical protein
MIAIDWLQLCELAFFDKTNRLCLIGIARHLPVPKVPLVLTQHMLVAHLVRDQRDEAIDLSLGLLTPSARWITPDGADAVSVEIVDDYVLITLKSLPLREEGLYRFDLSMNDELAASLDMPVWVAGRQTSFDVH